MPTITRDPSVALCFSLLVLLGDCLPNGPPTLTVEDTAARTASVVVEPVRPQRADRSSRAREDTPLTEPFEDTFERAELGRDWRALSEQWRISGGRLCVRQAENQGVWLTRKLPVNARIEFDAIARSPEGDIKAELWGDGASGAEGKTYNNATSYLAIFGGWKNTQHVLAKGNEHGTDRKVRETNEDGANESERPVGVGRIYRMQVQRTDGHTLTWLVNGVVVHTWNDPSPLVGTGHDHVGFANWQSPVCFDNVKVTPLP